ncbi:ABC transporter ATP-binding protein [Paenibacillus sp. N3/727]|uniref:ABC transporter ATP-binding protein n=1 Tax=Paenibacillus sp. N3/727 TaxID=2925845 RepID=UPI001F52F1D2|nr:ABC transporter ATP-binding protein [Paenibacillus sp. N3/727]UNK18216.1 ABC transporter ATP-binding protein [Paenibacillus sp. N3/727]
MQTIHVDNVSKSFGSLNVLEQVDITIRQGEFAAIVGPSGCGKSTVLRMIAGLEHPSDGKITASEQSIVEPDPSRMLIFQEHALYPWRTVEFNVGFGLELAGISKKERKSRVDAMLEKVGLGGFQKYYPHQLSGGMRQRASIARALVTDPEVLLLDEPFGALDAITKISMQNELLTLWEGTGKTVLLITHDIDEAIYLADTIYVMSPRPGRIVESISTDMPRPRNRNGAEFVALRERIMKHLDLSNH